jgi:hypothetical protein
MSCLQGLAYHAQSLAWIASGRHGAPLQFIRSISSRVWSLEPLTPPLQSLAALLDEDRGRRPSRDVGE